MAYLAPNQMAYLVLNQTPHLAHNQRCNLLAALPSPSSLCRLAVTPRTASSSHLAAKEKAEDVHGRLDHNKNDASGTVIGQGIGKIEEAKDKVKQVDGQLKRIHSDLGNWKNAASDVLGTAVKKATEVHGKLDPDKSKSTLGGKIGEIEDAKNNIISANSQLKTQVDSLHSWIDTAEDIRAKAERKAKEAYDKLEPHEALSKQIGEIVTANKKINEVHKSMQGVSKNLGEWKSEAGTVLDEAVKKATEVHDALDTDQKSDAVGHPVGQAHGNVTGLVSKVTEAVKDLEAGMKDDLRRLQKDIVNSMKKHVGEMLLQIKGQVGQIKGKDRGDWGNSGASGLLGIEEAVHNYATAFRNNNFAEIAKGWLEASEPGTSEKDDISAFAIGMKEKLNADVIGIAKLAFEGVNTVSGSIHTNINAVKTACEAFANALDKELLQQGNKIVNKVKEEALPLGKLVSKITRCVCECDAQCTKCKNGECGKKAAAELIMCALTSTVRQVGKELNSVFLGEGAKVGSNRSIAEELDRVVKETRELDDNLGEAAKEARNGPQPPTSGNQDNEILNKVKEIKTEVNKGMKQDAGHDLNVQNDFEEIMKNYKGKKGGTGQLHQLTTQHIPQAMSAFKDMDGFSAEERPNDKDVSKATEAVTKHFTNIEKELQAIAWSVDNTKHWPTGLSDKPQDEDGIKQRLEDLTQMLKEEESVDLKDKGLIVESVKGLDAIREAIETLKADTYDDKTKHIGDAVQTIKTQLKGLREKLKKEQNGGTKDGVIDVLDDLKTAGVEGKNGWKGTQGLTKIQQGIQEQNTELGKQPEIITNAISAIRDQLFQLGIKLNKPFDYDDVLDKLIQLQRKLGTADAQNYGVNLKKIYDEIHWQQISTFTHKPYEIQAANSAIKEALNEQRSTLGSEVIEKLTNMMTKGLSNGASWNDDNKDVKGLDNIKIALEKQQSELTGQPQKIQDGVTQITDELTELRKELQGEPGNSADERGVIKNMEFVIKKIGQGKNEGLEKIKKEIEDLNRDTVPKVSEHLNELCAKIASEAGSVDWKLGLFKENNIDKDLAKIKSDIHTLRTGDLQAAIAMCDKFLTNADYIKWEKVENIERFVDSEIEKAIAELTKEARRDYVESAKDALKHFALKAESELETLPKEIDEDLTIGYKGLMKQMEGERSENINRLRNVQSRMLRALSSAFQNFFAPLHEYLREEIERVKKQSDDEKNPSLPKSEEPYAADYLCVTQGFDDRLRGLLHNLTDALTQLTPQSFQKPSTPTLDSVSRGLSAFAGEFGGAYISTYSGAECREADADKYAKVLLSMIPMTHEALSNLVAKCGTNWKSNKICKLTGDDRDNGLGNYLTKCGFKVSPTDGLQEGELQNRFSGGAVHELLASPVAEVTTKMLIDGKPAENGINVVDLVALFYNMVCRYLQACHLKVHESPRYPCTVRDMLSWLTGLQYTPVADKLPDHCRALLNRKCDDNDAPNREDKVMVQCINGLPFTIAEACSYANSLLVTIQGHGRGFDLAAYPYSVDFANNTAQLYYPDDPAEVLDMLRGIVCRLCRVLYFLYAQCCRATATTKGWRECHYGRQVPSSHWQCNTYDNQATDASHNCPPTSPLQSFLTDSCPSLLPHKLSVVDNAIECANCPSNQPGQQCLTPLGFWDLGLAASVARQDLASHSAVSAVTPDTSRTLRLLCPSAPQSLGDVFALFFQMLRVWDHESSRRAYSHHESYQTHLSDEAIDKLFPLWTQLHGSYQNSNLTDALKALAGHDHDNSGHNALSSLSAEPPCQSPSGCAPSSSCCGTRHLPAEARTAVSWIVWLAWQLWTGVLLDAEQHRSFSAVRLCRASVSQATTTTRTPATARHSSNVADLCRHSTATDSRIATPTPCSPAARRCGAVTSTTNSPRHPPPFTQLFHQIDQLLYTIRMPFLFCLVTLWLTATLYIAHSLCYRMDVLHIRSHLLTTRASHLIDVKALLAGSRRMLSLYKDVDYFDDDLHS
ncbi:Extracellular matrix-binding ebh, putative [Babesia ovata]|uniref:Extracellular matrix-binding ebh, putative n=1 Tax=Babesia ovata TaxID=189622 RepID=A0A2H6KK72_9APIC|nr:Extracellular matrix-binding ebh, putative [Babesia ovata]GBE63378.1 Extracellular matrix-binding ebh, putative [Babesia ovata]